MSIEPTIQQNIENLTETVKKIKNVAEYNPLMLGYLGRYFLNYAIPPVNHFQLSSETGEPTPLEQDVGVYFLKKLKGEDAELPSSVLLGIGVDRRLDTTVFKGGRLKVRWDEEVIKTVRGTLEHQFDVLQQQIYAHVQENNEETLDMLDSILLPVMHATQLDNNNDLFEQTNAQKPLEKLMFSIYLINDINEKINQEKETAMANLKAIRLLFVDACNTHLFGKFIIADFDKIINQSESFMHDTAVSIQLIEKIEQSDYWKDIQQILKGNIATLETINHNVKKKFDEVQAAFCMGEEMNAEAFISEVQKLIAPYLLSVQIKINSRYSIFQQPLIERTEKMIKKCYGENIEQYIATIEELGKSFNYIKNLSNQITDQAFAEIYPMLVGNVCEIRKETLAINNKILALTSENEIPHSDIINEAKIWHKRVSENLAENTMDDALLKSFHKELSEIKKKLVNISFEYQKLNYKKEMTSNKIQDSFKLLKEYENQAGNSVFVQAFHRELKKLSDELQEREVLLAGYQNSLKSLLDRINQQKEKIEAAGFSSNKYANAGLSPSSPNKRLRAEGAHFFQEKNNHSLTSTQMETDLDKSRSVRRRLF